MSRSIGTAVALAVVFTAATVQAQDSGGLSFTPYVEGGIGVSWTEFETGGFNTAGTFANVVETPDKSGVSGKLAIGAADIITFGPASLRVEGEFSIMPSETFVTGSFPGAPTPTFFYRTQTAETYRGMANIWVDFRPLDDMPVILSVGGGIGGARLEAWTNDGVVNGYGKGTKFAWNVGAQAAYVLGQDFTAGLEARYYDLGSLDMSLTSIGGGGPAGNYTLDYSSFYAGAFLRLTLGDLFD